MSSALLMKLEISLFDSRIVFLLCSCGFTDVDPLIVAGPPIRGGADVPCNGWDSRNGGACGVAFLDTLLDGGDTLKFGDTVRDDAALHWTTLATLCPTDGRNPAPVDCR